MSSRTAAYPASVGDDVELVTAALRGDVAAFGRLVERYQTAVRSFAFALSGSSVQCDEIAQDVFLIAWRRLGAFDTQGSFGGWLYGITHNVSRNARRGRRAAGLVDRGGAAADDLAAGGSSPLELVIRRQEERLLWRALEEIPETYRVPIVLFYRDELALEGVAHVLGISQTSVKSRLMRGRRLLAKQVIALLKAAGRATTAKNLAPVVLSLSAIPPADAAAAVSNDAADRPDEISPPRSRAVLRRLGMAATPALLGAAAYVMIGPTAGTAPRFLRGATLSRGGVGVRPVRLAPAVSTGFTTANRGRSADSSLAEPAVIYSFDFEDEILPAIFERGHIVPPPAGNPSRYCVRATVNLTWPDSQSILLALNQPPYVYTYSPDDVLSFDYWIGRDFSDHQGSNEELQVYMRNLDQGQNYSVLNYDYVPETWQHFERPLASLPGGKERSRLQQPGDRIEFLAIDGGKLTGKPFFVDNIRILSRRPRSNDAEIRR